MPEFDERILNDKRFKKIQNDETFLSFNRYYEEQDEARRQEEANRQAHTQEQAELEKQENKIADVEEEHEQNALSADNVRVDAMNIRGENVLAKRYSRMKNIVRDTEPEEIEEMNFDQALEWAMSSAIVDGASDTFMAFVKKMVSFRDQVSQLERDYEVKATDSKLQKELKERYISGKKQNLIFDINNLAEVYLIKVKGHKFTKKGKARETLAKHIVSIMTGGNRLPFVRIDSFDDTSRYIHDQIARMSSNASVTLQKQDLDENSGYRMLCDKFKIHERHQEKCFYDWTNDNFAEREKDRKQVNEAMEWYAKGEDPEPMYAVMDKRLREYMEFTISDSFFDKEWVAKNVDKVLEFQAMSQRDGDLFTFGSKVIGPVSDGYMERMKNTNPEFFELVCKKGHSITVAWSKYQEWFAVNIGIKVGNTMAYNIDYKEASENEYTEQWRVDGDEDGLLEVRSAKALLKIAGPSADPTTNIEVSVNEMKELLTRKYASMEIANLKADHLGWENIEHQAPYKKAEKQN